MILQAMLRQVPTEGDELLKLALVDWLMDGDGEDLERWRAAHREGVYDLSTLWASCSDGSMRRVDGVWLTRGLPDCVAWDPEEEQDRLLPKGWYQVSFPRADGQLGPVHAFEAPDMVFARAWVDLNYPLPDWWWMLDAEDLKQGWRPDEVRT